MEMALATSDDKLWDFLQQVRYHQLATLTYFKPAFDMLGDVDDGFIRLLEKIEKPQINKLPSLFLYRSHAAYRAACGTSMAGQSPETFVLLRSCLEYSGYALQIHQKPTLDMIWLRRHKDDDALRAMRKQFTYENVKKAVQSTDAGLGSWYSQLYERAIDFGAHPNAKGVTLSMSWDEGSIYLHDDNLALHHCLDSTARTGLCSLYVFQHVLSEQFISLGLGKKLQELGRRGHL
jgi:hypothetical protein